MNALKVPLIFMTLYLYTSCESNDVDDSSESAETLQVSSFDVTERIIGNTFHPSIKVQLHSSKRKTLEYANRKEQTTSLYYTHQQQLSESANFVASPSIVELRLSTGDVAKVSSVKPLIFPTSSSSSNTRSTVSTRIYIAGNGASKSLFLNGSEIKISSTSYKSDGKNATHLFTLQPSFHDDSRSIAKSTVFRQHVRTNTNIFTKHVNTSIETTSLYTQLEVITHPFVNSSFISKNHRTSKSLHVQGSDFLPKNNGFRYNVSLSSRLTTSNVYAKMKSIKSQILIVRKNSVPISLVKTMILNYTNFNNSSSATGFITYNVTAMHEKDSNNSITTHMSRSALISSSSRKLNATDNTPIVKRMSTEAMDDLITSSAFLSTSPASSMPTAFITSRRISSVVSFSEINKNLSNDISSFRVPVTSSTEVSLVYSSGGDPSNMVSLRRSATSLVENHSTSIVYSFYDSSNDSYNHSSGSSVVEIDQVSKILITKINKTPANTTTFISTKIDNQRTVKLTTRPRMIVTISPTKTIQSYFSSNIGRNQTSANSTARFNQTLIRSSIVLISSIARINQTIKSATTLNQTYVNSTNRLNQTFTISTKRNVRPCISSMTTPNQTMGSTTALNQAFISSIQRLNQTFISPTMKHIPNFNSSTARLNLSTKSTTTLNLTFISPTARLNQNFTSSIRKIISTKILNQTTKSTATLEQTFVSSSTRRINQTFTSSTRRYSSTERLTSKSLSVKLNQTSIQYTTRINQTMFLTSKLKESSVGSTAITDQIIVSTTLRTNQTLITWIPGMNQSSDSSVTYQTSVNAAKTSNLSSIASTAKTDQPSFSSASGIHQSFASSTSRFSNIATGTNFFSNNATNLNSVDSSPRITSLIIRSKVTAIFTSAITHTTEKVFSSTTRNPATVKPGENFLPSFLDDAHESVLVLRVLIPADQTKLQKVVAIVQEYDKNAAAPQLEPISTWYKVHYDGKYRNHRYRALEITFKDMNMARMKRGLNLYKEIKLGIERCKPQTKLICNGPLREGASYRLQLKIYSVGASSKFTQFTLPHKTHAKTPQKVGPNSTILIILSVLLVCFVVLILLISLVVLRRRHQRGRSVCGDSSTDGIRSTLMKPSQKNHTKSSRKKFSGPDILMERRKSIKGMTRPVSIRDFRAWVDRSCSDSDFRFAEEFESMRDVGKFERHEVADMPENRGKNRYVNVLSYDYTRVKLSSIDDEPGSDYINANYIHGFKQPRAYIATQGPLPSTTDDFWRMAWEQNTRVIVMVTQCMERGRVKCHQYWPTTQTTRYGDILVTLLSETKCPEWIERELLLEYDGETRELRHFQYVAWPDHGVPKSTSEMLDFIQTVKFHQTPNDGPLICHCSAGVGRTGTYLCVDVLINKLKYENNVDVYGVVCLMRTQRCSMVQTEDQYIFIHRVVLHYLQQRDEKQQIFSGYSTLTSIHGKDEKNSCKVVSNNDQASDTLLAADDTSIDLLEKDGFLSEFDSTLYTSQM